MNIFRAALHLEAGPIFLEANCTKFQHLLGQRPASSIQYKMMTMGAILPCIKALGSRNHANSIKTRKEQEKG